MKIHHAPGGVQYWHDRSTRCWWAAMFDASGDQVGQAIHACTRQEIEEAIRSNPDWRTAP